MTVTPSANSELTPLRRRSKKLSEKKLEKVLLPAHLAVYKSPTKAKGRVSLKALFCRPALAT